MMNADNANFATKLLSVPAATCIALHHHYIGAQNLFCGRLQRVSGARALPTMQSYASRAANEQKQQQATFWRRQLYGQR